MKLLKTLVAAAAVFAGVIAFSGTAHAASAPFIAMDSNGALVTTATVFNGEVIAHNGVAHTVVDARTANGVTQFHLTNPLNANGPLVFVQV